MCSAYGMPVNFSSTKRANTVMLAPAQLIDDEVKPLLPNGQVRTRQRKNVMGQPLSECSDVGGKRMCLCRGLTGELQPSGKILTTRARFADLGLQLLAP